MMVNFWRQLKKNKNALEFAATGNRSGHVITVKPKKGAKEIFVELVALLGPGLFGAIGFVCRSIIQASKSQALGICGAKPIPGSTVIGLYGYCLEGFQDKPKKTENYIIVTKPSFPIARINKFIKAMKKNIPRFFGDYVFLEELSMSRFVPSFTQVGIWIITDNIGIIRVKLEIFPEIMFFTSGSTDILFWLRKTLIDAGENIETFQFEKGLIDLLHINYNMGFITDAMLNDWQERFGVTLPTGTQT